MFWKRVSLLMSVNFQKVNSCFFMSLLPHKSFVANIFWNFIGRRKLARKFFVKFIFSLLIQNGSCLASAFEDTAARGQIFCRNFQTGIYALWTIELTYTSFWWTYLVGWHSGMEWLIYMLENVVCKRCKNTDASRDWSIRREFILWDSEQCWKIWNGVGVSPHPLRFT